MIAIGTRILRRLASATTRLTGLCVARVAACELHTSSSMGTSLQVRPATADMFGDVCEVLMEFGSGLGEAQWRHLFDYEFEGSDRKDRGWVLCDGDAVIGFLGAIFSRRGDEPFCNVTSWVVKKTHRSSGGLQLLLPMLALEDHTILNLSPTPFTRAVFQRMGFRKTGTHRFVMGSDHQTDHVMRREVR